MSPTSTVISNKVSKRCLATLLGLAVGLSIALMAEVNELRYGQSLIYPVFDGETFPTTGAAANGRATVAVPEYLAGVVPKTVNGFTCQDVDWPKGQYKLVVWSRWAEDESASGESTSQIELVALGAGGKATRVWQSEKVEGLYEPRIKIVKDWRYRGHQVFLILRQKGAAWAVADPVWVEGEMVHSLPSVSCEYVEIGALGDRGKHQLICHERAVPQTLDIPEIYRWDGSSFAGCDGAYPQVYSKLADENQSLLTESNQGVCNLYGQSVLLDRAGRTREALALLKKSKRKIEASDDPELIACFHQLLSRLEKN
jgi:hypothetical protein